MKISLALLGVGLLLFSAWNLITPDPAPAPASHSAVVLTESVEPEFAEELSPEIPSEVSVSEDTSPRYLVTRVIDGDTIEVAYEGRRRPVRYIGIDTPETVHPSRPVECFGAEAAARNRELVAGKVVRLERDITDTDKYDRLLRYVYVEDDFINERLVREGFATVFTYPPDVKYTEALRAAEMDARQTGRGLWGADCVSRAPFRPQTDTGEICVVKGNISQTSGERIYHVPGCEYYDQTVITMSAGEQWFCTEADALAAGWRKALNCP